MCRTIKVFLVGKAMRGKTTLLYKLSNQPDKKIGRTVGIDIVKFSYTPVKPTLFHKGKEPVQFLVWDFVGQVCIHNASTCTVTLTYNTPI